MKFRMKMIHGMGQIKRDRPSVKHKDLGMIDEVRDYSGITCRGWN